MNEYFSENKLKDHLGRILIEKVKGRTYPKVKRSFNVSSDSIWEGLICYYSGEHSAI